MATMRKPGWSRTASAVVAILLAALATFAVAQYVGGLEAQAFEEAELVEVFVADGLIPVGATGADAIRVGLVIKGEMLRQNVPAGALTQLAGIESLVAVERILPGEVLQVARWGQPGDLPGSFEIPEGMHAMSVQIDVPTGVANIISAGDRVSLIAHVAREGEEETLDGDGNPLGIVPDDLDLVEIEPGLALQFHGGWSQFVLQDVEVLAIGERIHTAEGDERSVQPQQGTVLLTLAVTPEQAEMLALATFEVDLYATLLPEGAGPVETRGATLADLFK